MRGLGIVGETLGPDANLSESVSYQDGLSPHAAAQQRLENRRVALLAAGMSWGGISSVRARNETVLQTADAMLAWLERRRG